MRIPLIIFLVPFSFFLSAALGAAEAATLRGIVRDPDGRSVPGARVIVTGAQPRAVETLTDVEGRFELTSLSGGRHEVRIALDGFSADPQTIHASDDSVHDIVLTLRVSAMSESLVVSAAQVDLPLSQTAAAVTVVTGSDIAARQIRTVADALRSVPGLAIAQNGTIGSLASLFTRGGESDFTLVLIDGMRANAFGGGLDLSQVPLVDAERIEIVRGPQSAVFGSDAIGGVVQIVTRRCSAGSGDAALQRCGRFDAAAEGGSLGTARGRFAGAGTHNALSWSVNGEHAQTEGYTGIAPATGETVGNDDGRAQHAGGAIGWAHSGGADVRAQAQLSVTERGFPGAYGSNPIGAYTAVDRVSRGETNRRQLGVQWMQPLGGPSSRVRQRTDVGVTDFDSNFVSPFGASESDTRRVAFRTQTDAALATELGISAGLEMLREQAGSTFITGEVFEPIPVKRLVGGYFGELRYSPTMRLSAAGGVRVEQIRREALASNPSTFSPRPAFPQETIVSANPRLALGYLLRGGNGARASTRLRASAGTGIRPPDAFEIAFTDNPTLKPERSRSVDAGVQQTFARGAALVDATVFFNEYDDLIVAVGRSFRDASRYRTDNISNARSRGLELSAAIRPLPALNLRGSYTLLDTDILAVDGSTEAPAPYRVGEHLIRRPRHRGVFTALFNGTRVTAFAELEMRGAVRDIEPTFGASGGVFDADGFAVLDLGGAYRVSKLLQLFARAENVADRAYEEAFGFPAPGRLFMAGVRVAAGR
jgi:outer membrane cobalamin receptor